MKPLAFISSTKRARNARGFDRVAGRLEDHQFEWNAQALRERRGQVDRYAARFARRRVDMGKDRIAEVDRRAQNAGRGEAGNDVAWHVGFGHGSNSILVDARAKVFG